MNTNILKYLRMLVALTFFFVFSFLLIGKNLQSKWWIIDDHEIVAYIGKDFRLSARDWWISLKGSEAFHPGVSPRYRPVYYFLRFTEMSLWGKSPFGWYIARFLIFVIFQFVMWLIIRKWIGNLLSAIYVIYLLLPAFWYDLVLRLGPSEIYAVVGICLYAIGFIKLWLLPTGKISWLIYIFGTLLCVGSKENFIFLLPLICLVCLRTTLLKKWSIFGVVSWLFVFITTMFIFWAFFVSSQNIGSDIYSQTTNIYSRLLLLSDGLRLFSTNYIVWLFPIQLLVVLLYSVYKHIFTKQLLFKLLHFVLWYVYFIVVWISQYIFYNGIWPQGNRYDFPGVLVIPILWLENYIFLQYLLKLFKLNRYSIFISICFGLYLFFNIYTNGFTEFREAVNNNLSRTQHFTDNMTDLTNGINHNSGCNIVVMTDNPWDYEGIVSVGQFLESEGVKNSYSVKPFFCDRHYDDKMLLFLSKSICDWSNYGGFVSISTPYDNNSANQCCIGFGNFSDNRCRFYVNFQ